MSEAMNAREAYLRSREFLKRAGWSSAAMAEAMGVSEITVRQYAQAPGLPGSRVIPCHRLARLQDAAKREAAELVMTAMELVAEENGR